MNHDQNNLVPQNKSVNILINTLIALVIAGFIVLFFYWGSTSYYFQIPGWLGVSGLFSALGASVLGLIISLVDKYVKKRPHGTAITVFVVGIILWIVVYLYAMAGAIASR
jgi:uncharacterized membrane protein